MANEGLASDPWSPKQCENLIFLGRGDNPFAIVKFLSHFGFEPQFITISTNLDFENPSSSRTISVFFFWQEIARSPKKIAKSTAGGFSKNNDSP